MPKQEQPNIRPATPSDTPAIVDILSKAFAGDPFFDWLIRQDEDADERRRCIFHAFVTLLGFGQGEAWIGEAGKSAAIWFPPHRWRVGTTSQIRLLPRFIRAAGLRNSWSRYVGINHLERHHPEGAHIYLMTIGVIPENQGCGYGGELLRSLIRSCDSGALPAYLETAKESNIAFYQRYGFEVLEEFNLSHDGPTIWTMWRE